MLINYEKKILLLLCLVVSGNSRADDSPSIFDLSLEELLNISVVTAASGFEQKLSQAPATVTVITAEEWQTRGATNLSDVLTTVAGFHVSMSKLSFQHAKYFSRGLSGTSSSKIKLLIDGEPMAKMLESGLFSGFHMPLSHFKRIEVIKGPGSVIYGADAFGGIINLVTYLPEELPSSVGVKAGSFNTHEGYWRHQLPVGDSTLQLSLNYSRSDDDAGRIVSADLQTLFDGIFDTQASNAPGPIDEHYQVFTLLGKWQWQDVAIEHLLWRNFDAGLAGGAAQALDPYGKTQAQYNRTKFSYDFSELVTGELIAAIIYRQEKFRNHLNVFPAGSVIPIGTDGNANFVDPVGLTLFTEGYIGVPATTGYATTYQLTHLFNAAKQHLVRWQIGFDQQNFRAKEHKNFGPGILTGSEPVVSGTLTEVTGTPYIYMPNITRHFYYLTLNDEWQLTPQLKLDLGMRYDNYSDFGNTTNPRVSLTWQSSDAFTLKMFAGSAFQAPSLQDQHIQNNPILVGNSDLTPESVNTQEIGLNFAYLVQQNLTIAVNLYYYQAKKLIEFVENPLERVTIAQNVGEQKGRGGELSLKWKPRPKITVDVNYAHLNASDEHDLAIADVPENMAYVGASWKIDDHWLWGLEAKWVADRPRKSTDMRPAIADYILVNSKIAYKGLINKLDIALIAKNLFDRNARHPTNGSIADDFPLPKRQILLEMDYHF